MFGLDLRSLAVFRIAIAAVMLVDLLVRATDLGAFYTDSGVLPRSVLLSKTPYLSSISVHLWNGTPLFQALLFILAGVGAIGLLIGYRTRSMTCLCWFLTASLHARNFLVLQGGDDYLRMSLFWSMFLPLEARWSVDSARRLPSDKIPDRVFSWGTFAFTFQTILLYVSTAIFKSRGDNWLDGSALYYALSLDCFAKRPAFILLLFPKLLKFMTRGVLAFEFLGSFLFISPVWNGPIRTLGVFGFWSLHLGIMMTMAIGLFQWVSLAVATAFLPPWFWHYALRPLNALRKRVGVQAICLSLQRVITPWLDSIPRTKLNLSSSFYSAPIILFFLFCIICWDLSLLYPQRYPLPRVLNDICVTTHVTQRWAMFSPNITKTSGWFVIPGKLRNGAILDLYNRGQPLSWSTPPLISSYYKNDRWRKYLMNMSSRNMRAYRIDFSRYLCRSWNSSHSEDEKLNSLELIFVDRRNLPDYRTTIYERTVLWQAYCSEEGKRSGPTLPSLPFRTEKNTNPSDNNAPKRLIYDSPYAP